MRRFGLSVATMVAGIGILSGTLLLPVPAAGSPEEEAVKARVQEFAAAWNKHDAKAMAALWAEDGDLINPFGREAKGRAEVEKLFVDEHAKIMKGTTYSVVTFRRVQMPASGVAIVTYDSVVNGMKGADGTAMPPFEHVVTAVWVQKDGTWWIAAARPMTPDPVPAAAPATEAGAGKTSSK